MSKINKFVDSYVSLVNDAVKQFGTYSLEDKGLVEIADEGLISKHTKQFLKDFSKQEQAAILKNVSFSLEKAGIPTTSPLCELINQIEDYNEKDWNLVDKLSGGILSEVF